MLAARHGRAEQVVKLLQQAQAKQLARRIFKHQCSRQAQAEHDDEREVRKAQKLVLLLALRCGNALRR